jgi:DNA polymerase III epsilon subunit-like protein
LGGHRIVEIGAVELVDHSPTGPTFHRYMCPSDSFINPLVYTFWSECGPSIMTMSSALAE